MFFSSKRGFSIIELLVVLGVAIFIIIAVWFFWLGSFRFNEEIRNNLISTAEARRAGELMTKEIRNITNSLDGSYPISKAEPFSFSFFTIDSSSGQILKVRYFDNDGKLKRGVIFPNSTFPYYDDDREEITTIFKNINSRENSLFEYFDGFYEFDSQSLPEPVDVSLVRLIGINIYNNNSKIIFSTKISLRNIKDNL